MGDRRPMIYAELDRAKLDIERGRPVPMQDALHRTIASGLSSGDRNLVSKTRISRALVSWSHGDFDGALRDLDAATAQYGESSRKPMKAQALLLRGMVLRSKGDAAGADQALRAARELLEQSPTGRARGEAWLQLGILSVDRGRGEEAVDFAKRAEEEFRRIGSPEGEMYARILRGRALATLGGRAEALRLAKLEGRPSSIYWRVQASLLKAALQERRTDQVATLNQALKDVQRAGNLALEQEIHRAKQHLGAS